MPIGAILWTKVYKPSLPPVSDILGLKLIHENAIMLLSSKLLIIATIKKVSKVAGIEIIICE